VTVPVVEGYDNVSNGSVWVLSRSSTYLPGNLISLSLGNNLLRRWLDKSVTTWASTLGLSVRRHNGGRSQDDSGDGEAHREELRIEESRLRS
jgi:hypothetical protein